MSTAIERFKRWVSELTGDPGKALHVRADGRHAVMVSALRVLLVKEGQSLWSAVGVEIDYAACGASEAEAQENFERGLAATVQAHIERFGGIDRLLKYTPQEEIRRILGRSTPYEYSAISVHDLRADESFPYRRVAYLPPVRLAA